MSGNEPSSTAAVRAADVVRHRIAMQGFGGPGVGDAARVLDLGVQDTGPDGSAWALALRGVDAGGGDELSLAWTIRGAPHAYRRNDLPQVWRATAPLSEADAAKRVINAAKPLHAAGIRVLDALHTIASEMSELVTEPMVKGDLSTALAERMPPPYLRDCRVCDATHLYEMPFRLCALYAGLELAAGTSPPVLRPAPELAALPVGPADDPLDAPPRLQPVRAFLRLHAPATMAHAAWYLDASAADLKRVWPKDAVPVSVGDEQRWVLEQDLPLLAAPPRSSVTALLGPFDPLVQTKDRELLVPDEAARKDVWRTIGRPGVVLHRDALVGSWRPRSKGKRLDVQVQVWGRPSTALTTAVQDAAERLAAYRGRALGQVAFG